MRDTSFTTYSAYTSAKKNYPGISIVPERRSPLVKEKKNIVYCIRDRRKLLLDIFYPAKKKNKRIAVMMIHGGGWRSGDRSQHYPLAERLAALGYVCIIPEYRLSTEALYPAAVFDLKAALKWLRVNARKFDIDTGKIAVAGFSSGGELAAFLGVTRFVPQFTDSSYNVDQATVSAVIDIDGILSFVHPESGEGDDSKKTSASTYWFGYGRNENPALLTAASPLSYAGAGTPPFLFINSSVARMHAGRDDFIRILDANHIYSEVHTFENAPHAFCLFDPWFEPTIAYIDKFLKHVFKK